MLHLPPGHMREGGFVRSILPILLFVVGSPSPSLLLPFWQQRGGCICVTLVMGDTRNVSIYIQHI